MFAFISVPTPEVKKVKEDLRRSLEDLQNVVEDPLPNAKEIASRIIASKSIDVKPLQEPVENHSQVKKVAPFCIVVAFWGFASSCKYI